MSNFFKLKNTKSGWESTCLPHAGVKMTFSHSVAPSPSMSAMQVPGAYGLTESWRGALNSQFTMVGPITSSPRSLLFAEGVCAPLLSA